MNYFVGVGVGVGVGESSLNKGFKTTMVKLCKRLFAGFIFKWHERTDDGCCIIVHIVDNLDSLEAML